MTATAPAGIRAMKGEAPAYTRLAQAIRAMITAQGLRPGTLLPTEKRLQERFGVSRATVREALALLERERIIDRRQGKGTYVALPPLERNLMELTSFSEDMRKRGLTPASVLLQWDDHPGAVPEELDDGEQIVRIVRLRLVNDEPFGLHEAFLPAAVLQQAGVSAEAMAADPALSLYACLDRAGLGIRQARERITACAATAFEARQLLCAEGSPLLHVRRVSREGAGRLIEVVLATYLPDVYPYIIELERR
jgi:GntR family transcriptional regulator